MKGWRMKVVGMRRKMSTEKIFEGGNQPAL